MTDPAARYFGAVLGERSLVPANGAHIADTRLADWSTQATHKQ